MLPRLDDHLSLLLYVSCFYCFSEAACPQVHTPTHPNQRQHHEYPAAGRAEKHLDDPYLQSIRLSKSPTHTGENFIWKSCSCLAGMVPLRGSTENGEVALMAFRDELREEDTCSTVRPSRLEQRLDWSFTVVPEVKERKSPVAKKRLWQDIFQGEKSVSSTSASCCRWTEGSWDALEASQAKCFQQQGSQ